jgi:predicted TIM-barrel fold metal-dependent hydrolase
MAKYPTRFGGFATVPGRDPDGALREIEYALDTLKLDALGTTTSLNDGYLGDRRFDPWFAEANRRGVPLFIHPTRLSLTERMDLGMNVAVLEFMFDTTRMLMNMVLEGTKKKYPAIKMISTHGGGTMPFLVERAQILLTHYGAGRDRAPISAAEIKEVLGSFYFDLTAATTDIHLAALLDLVPPTQLLMGFDIPYMPPSSFKPAIERINASPRFTESERKLVFQDNAARLFPAAAARLGLGA